MDPDFAGLEFPRFTKEEDSQVTEQNATTTNVNAPSSAPAAPEPADIPWLGNLYGAIKWPFGKKPVAPIATATAPEVKPSVTPEAKPAEVKPAASSSPVVVNVFEGKKAKAKKKPATEGESK